MSKPEKIAGKLRDIATEVEAQEVLGKVDWSKILSLVTQLLPLILAFFATEKPEEE